MALNKIAIITCGGDAPGLNSFLSACFKALIHKGFDVIGIKNGFEGFLKEESLKIDEEKLSSYAAAGTFLGTSSRLDVHGRENEFLTAFRNLNIQGLIICGGDGTFSALNSIYKELPLIGIPKTIDNDLRGSDLTIGFNTAVTSVVKSIDALRATANSLGRSFVVETMGRHAGWIALASGLASFADIILIPEKFQDKEDLKKHILKIQKNNIIIVASEGSKIFENKETVDFYDPSSKEKEKLGGVSRTLARWLEKETKIDFRHQVIGYLQRAHPPTSTDRMIAIEMGIQAAHLAANGQWNRSVSWAHGGIEIKKLSEFMGDRRVVPLTHPWILEAQDVGIYI